MPISVVITFASTAINPAKVPYCLHASQSKRASPSNHSITGRLHTIAKKLLEIYAPLSQYDR